MTERERDERQERGGSSDKRKRDNIERVKERAEARLVEKCIRNLDCR